MRKARYLLFGTLGVLFLAVAGAGWADDLPVGGTSVSGKLFLNASHLDQDVNGVRTDDSGTNADLKRFFINVDHRFSDVWSAHVTTDIHWQRHQDPTDLWLRYAYVQGRFSKAFNLRLGSAPMPWQGLVNQWYGYRYVEKDATMRAGVGSTADWGVHALGSLGADGRVEYAASLATGAGYKKPRLGNGPDVAARVSFQPGEHVVVGLGGYRGTLGQDAGKLDSQRTAQRWSLMAAYADAKWRLGGQYFRANDWSQVMSPQSDRSHGWSAWASMQLTPEVSLFARHDHVEPSRWLDPERRDRYTNAGVEWQAYKWLRLAAVWKRERLSDGGRRLKTANEAGLWAQITF